MLIVHLFLGIFLALSIALWTWTAGFSFTAILLFYAFAGSLGMLASVACALLASTKAIKSSRGTWKDSSGLTERLSGPV